MAAYDHILIQTFAAMLVSANSPSQTRTLIEQLTHKCVDPITKEIYPDYLRSVEVLKQAYFDWTGEQLDS